MTTTKPQRHGSASNTIFTYDPSADLSDGYMHIKADGSIVASAFSAVPNRAGRYEVVPGSSWTPLGTFSKSGSLPGTYELTLNNNYLRLLACVPTVAINQSNTVPFDVVVGNDNVNPATTGSQKIIFKVRASDTGVVTTPNVDMGIRFIALLKR